MTDEIEAAADALRILRQGGEADSYFDVPHGERPCSICGQRMGVEEIRGVPVDVCREHGVWLDLGELDTIVAAAQEHTRQTERAVRSFGVDSARREGKIAGAFLGLWSLLLE